jgi:serine protease AprX
MKKYLFFALLIVLGLNLKAQLAPHKYLIRFKDKNNSPYSISTPSQFLSPKAILRRTKQNISIKYNDLPVTPAYVDSIVSTGVTLYCRSKWFNSITIYTTDATALAKINSFSFVLSVDSVTKNTNEPFKSISPEKLNLSDINLSNTLNNPINNEKINNYNYGFASNQITMIGGDYLHNHGFSGQGMTIAIIDAGFYYADTISAFDSLWANNQILGTRDFVNPGGNVFREYPHGMEVLSIMGANVPGQMVGTAPKANFWLLRSEDVATENIIEEYNWASAAEFADSVGADVINSSLGYTTFDQSWMDHTYADMNGHTCPASIAAATAASKGMVLCISAGNEGSSTWHYIGTPADADSIMTVGAVDASGNYASFSSTGPTSDGRIKPTVATQGQGTYVISTSGIPTAGNGTSFSSPILTGVTACLVQAFPNVSNMQIIQAIKESASQYTHPDSLLGWGIPNFAAAYALLSNVKVPDFENDNSINIFPNPFSDIIYILFHSSDTDRIDIDIFDIAGKKVYIKTDLHRNTGYSYFTIGNVKNLAKGMYFIKISSKDKVFTKKIMKQD